MLSQRGAEMFANAAVPFSKELISWATFENSTHVFPTRSTELVKRFSPDYFLILPIASANIKTITAERRQQLTANSLAPT